MKGLAIFANTIFRVVRRNQRNIKNSRFGLVLDFFRELRTPLPNPRVRSSPRGPDAEDQKRITHNSRLDLALDLGDLGIGEERVRRRSKGLLDFGHFVDVAKRLERVRSLVGGRRGILPGRTLRPSGRPGFEPGPFLEVVDPLPYWSAVSDRLRLRSRLGGYGDRMRRPSVSRDGSRPR